MGTRRMILIGAAAAALAVAATRFRHDQRAAHRRLAEVSRQTAPSRLGAVEFAERGEGPPVLVSHGIFHGCDGGLRSVRDIVERRRVIVPSRFGYLGSVLPDGATVADQADAFQSVLDHLGVETAAVIGISAGTAAAVEFALRHPERTDHLVVSSGSWPGSTTATAPPWWAKAFYNDPAMWAMKAVGGPALARMMGVPRGFPRDDDDRRIIADMVDSIFPVSPRAAGAVFDAYVGNPHVTTQPLEAVAVPTMVIHAVDDPLTSYEAAERAAGWIPGAELVSLDSGGHLGLGQSERIRREIEAFLG